MVRFTLASLRNNPLHLLLPVLATVMGVAFIAGTSIFADSMKAVAYEKAGKLYQNIDVSVGAIAPDLEEGEPGFNKSIIDTIAQLPEVAAVEGIPYTRARITGTEGRILKRSVLLGIPSSRLLSGLPITTGRLPEHTGEVVVDAEAAHKHGLHSGQRLGIRTDQGTRNVTVVGTVNISGTPLYAGGIVIGALPADVLTASDKATYREILISAAPGTTQKALAAAVENIVDTYGDVKTGQQLRDAALTKLVGDIDYFTSMLLVFVVTAIFVAAFVIANTFTIVLAQRARHTALLRLIGASRTQIFRSVLVEAAVAGLGAAVLGLAAGIGIVAVIQTVLHRLINFPASSLVVTWQTVAISLLVGTGVTVVSALIPAWRGTRIPPVAALTNAALEATRRVGWRRLGGGVLLLALGAALLCGAIVTYDILGLLLVACGAMLAFLGIALFGPLLIPLLTRIVGWPLRKIFGTPASLAISHAAHNPRRISATALALVIGISLVSAFQVGGESLKKGAVRNLTTNYGVDFIIHGDHGKGVSQELADALHKAPELGAVAETRTGWAWEGTLRVESTHPRFVLNDRRVREGDPQRLAPGTAVVTAPTGLHVGDTVTMQDKQLTIVSVVEEPKTRGVSDDSKVALITDEDFTALYPEVRPWNVLAMAAPGVSLDQAEQALDRLLEEYPEAVAISQAAFDKDLRSEIDEMLAYITALLTCAVLVSLLGISNTLALSVVERTRENGVLRAVGLTRGKLRGMLAVEAVIMGLVGALLGITLGTVASAGVVHHLNEAGAHFQLVIPWLKLVAIVTVAAAAAMAASILPARWALRRPVVECLAVD